MVDDSHGHTKLLVKILVVFVYVCKKIIRKITVEKFESKVNIFHYQMYNLESISSSTTILKMFITENIVNVSIARIFVVKS